MERGQLDSAVVRFKSAIAEFDYAPAYNNLGAAQLRRGEVLEAIWAYQRAVELDPKEPRHHFNLGLAYRRPARAAGHCRL